MLLGLGVAIAGTLQWAPAPLPEHAIARVDGTLILRRDFERALAGAREARRQPLSAAEEQAILQRLIDEQLLLSHGLDTNLVRLDPRLRKTTVDTVLQMLRADSAAPTVSDAELQRFYAEHQDYFARPPQLRVAVYHSDQRELLARHRQTLVAGGPGLLSPDPAIPSSLLPLAKLRGLAGPSLTELAEQQAGPGISPIVAHGDGFALLHIRQWQPGEVLPLERIRDRVSAEWQRRHAEQRFEQLLEDLRERYPVQQAIHSG